MQNGPQVDIIFGILVNIYTEQIFTDQVLDFMSKKNVEEQLYGTCMGLLGTHLFISCELTNFQHGSLLKVNIRTVLPDAKNRNINDNYYLQMKSAE